MLKQKQSWNTVWALLVALAAGPAFAAEPLVCTTSDAYPDAKGSGRWTITATEPFAVECLGTGEPCTRMDYEVSGSTLSDHVVVQVAADVEVVQPESNFVTGSCDVDTASGFGGQCHMQTVRLNSAKNQTNFTLVVKGTKVAVPSTVYVKKGRTAERCRIASLGADPIAPLDPFQSVAESTTIAFKDCKVTIPRNVADGTPGIASFAEGSHPDCAFVANGEPLQNLNLNVNGQSVGLTRFSTDFEAGSGDGSCSTQVIRGRVYSFCTCTDANGDGLPDDPRPPCR